MDSRCLGEEKVGALLGERARERERENGTASGLPEEFVVTYSCLISNMRSHINTLKIVLKLRPLMEKVRALLERWPVPCSVRL